MNLLNFQNCTFCTIIIKKCPLNVGTILQGHVYFKKSFFLLEGQLYQQGLVFKYFKNITKRYLENKENAYSVKKNPRASRALRQALDPSLLKLTLFTWLCFAMSGHFLKNNFGPPRPKSWVRHWSIIHFHNQRVNKPTYYPWKVIYYLTQCSILW